MFYFNLVKLKKATPVADTVIDYDTFSAAFPSSTWKFRTCGVGFVDNMNKKPKGVLCTDVNVVKAEDCAASFTPAITLPANSACLKGEIF